jgi:hypothetical protein
MWICASCGTEAQQIEVCSGCGSLMRLGTQALTPARPAVSFVLLLSESDVEAPDPDFIIGPFSTVLEADQWYDQHKEDERFATVKSKIIQVMEAPT